MSVYCTGMNQNMGVNGRTQFGQRSYDITIDAQFVSDEYESTVALQDLLRDHEFLNMILNNIGSRDRILGVMSVADRLKEL